MSRFRCTTCDGVEEKQKLCRSCGGSGYQRDVGFCPRPWDEVYPNLFTGGHDYDPRPYEEQTWFGSKQGNTAALDEAGFDVVISFYQYPGCMPSASVEHHEFFAIDGSLRDWEHQKIADLAQLAYDRLQEGKRVLIRCQAGLNRSSLCTVQVLRKLGYTSREAIDHLRATRSRDVLCNGSFVDYLLALDENETSTCAVCSDRIEYLDPTGDGLAGWWVHENHPADHHDALPAGGGKFVVPDRPMFIVHEHEDSASFWRAINDAITQPINDVPSYGTHLPSPVSRSEAQRLTRSLPLSERPKIDTPSLEGLGSHYNGIDIVDIGEDGDLLALGHIDPDRFIPAVKNHIIDHLGIKLEEYPFPQDPEYDDEEHVNHDYAVFVDYPEEDSFAVLWNRTREEGVPVTRWSV